METVRDNATRMTFVLYLRLSVRLDTAAHQEAACCRAKGVGFRWRSATHRVRSRPLSSFEICRRCYGRDASEFRTRIR